MLIVRSGKIPRILGVRLILGSVGYVGSFAGKIVYPDFRSLPFAGYLVRSATFGEIGTCLWLRLFGVSTGHASQKADSC